MRTYQKKYLSNGEENPKFKSDTRKGDRHTTKRQKTSKGKDKSKFERAKFVAWDGEGNDLPDGTQVYACLLSSDGDRAVNTAGLSTVECFECLLNNTSVKKAIHVIFAGSYDCNFFFKDIPMHLLENLQRGETIDWKLYQIEYRPRKQLTIRKNYVDVKNRWKIDAKGKAHKVYEKSIVLWDVYGFFQSSFLSALSKYFPEELQNDPVWIDRYQHIVTGKARRGSFRTVEFDDFVLPYCQAELDALVLLMDRLHTYIDEVGIVLSRWDGAGAVASAMLKKQGIKNYLSECPEGVQIAAQHAYSGGRIEPLQYGHYEGPVYHYDINSAYPSALTWCPSLAHGQWKQVKGPISTQSVYQLPCSFYLAKISWNIADELPAYPFPYRTKNNAILYPPAGKNWVWGPELIAALDTINGLWSATQLQIEELWYFQPDLLTPFAFVKDLYALRLAWKKTGKGAEKVLKLIINSLYGKMAQQTGFTVEQSGTRAKGVKKPPFHQLEYAGYVTSWTRARLYLALMQDPGAIISLATDGIYSTHPLNLDCGPHLGQWSFELHSSMTLVTSGVYWYTNPDGSEHAFYRGFDKGTLTRDNVLQSWELGKEEYYSFFDAGFGYTTIGSKGALSTRFMTLGAVLLMQPNATQEAKKRRFKDWLTWKTIERDLTLDMRSVIKRTDYEYRGKISPDKGLVKTRAKEVRQLRDFALPYPDMVLLGTTSVHLLSTPYPLQWKGHAGLEHETIDGIPAIEYYQEFDESSID